VEQKRLPEAETLFAQSVTGFENLSTLAPKSIDYQKHFGYVLEKQADLMAQTGKIVEARTALASAVDHQRQAMKLSRNRADVRELLGSHLLELAQINLKLGAYKQAAANALELPTAVHASARDQGCFDAARILARLVTKVGTDGKLTSDERQQLTRHYLGRTVVLLREAVDTNPKLADQIKTDVDIKILQSHPEFQAIMNTLVNIGK
jgi:eukaryotic-like serine/threonine-protein kinase